MGNGFRGKVFATEGTRDLLRFMLPDSGYIQEIEVEHLNRRNKQRGVAPVAPIYTSEGGEAAAEKIEPVDYQNWFEPGPGVRARLWNAGHILGSASVELEIETGRSDRRPMRLLYSGHVGADGLVEWVSARRPITRGVFLNHGEGEGLSALRASLVAAGFAESEIFIPRLDEEVDLEGGVIVKPAGPRRLPPEAVSAPDWRNDLAQLTLDIRAELEKAADERSRKIILRRVRRALEEDE